MFIGLYPADEHYASAEAEATKQLVADKRRLVSLYVFNPNATKAYVQLSDTDGDAQTGDSMWLPVEAGSFAAISWAGGKRMQYGIAVNALSAVTGGSAQNVFYQADWTAWA